MKCPCCRRGLRETTYEDTLIHACDGCGGEFLSGDALAHVVATRDERFPEQEGAPTPAPAFGLLDCEMHRPVACPTCSVVMTPSNYGGDSGVCVDRCQDCGGSWLEHGELEKVQVLSERWADEAPGRTREIAAHLEQARRDAARAGGGAFEGSRFAFVNALMNRLLDAA